MSKDFYDRQSYITAAKITFYNEYIKGYLPKILLTFGNCLIADLFCGAGKNGSKDGSPLVLIDSINYILTNDTINSRKPVIDILFNDENIEHVNNLNSHLEQHLYSFIKIRPVENVKFHNILPKILAEFKDETPKFFFLDPFAYSDVTIDNLKSLMMLPNSEVFLFIPVFHSYRFSNKQDYLEDHKTRIFIEEFTMRGMTDYADIDDFMQSIKKKIKQQLNLNYVRPILLDDGRNKNAIFLLTKHRVGMLLMNKIAFSQSDDGSGANIKIQQSRQGNLFGTKETSGFNIFANQLKQKLQNKGKMTNEEIIEFSIRKGFLPKHAKDVLNELCNKNKISVTNDIDNITHQKNKWNIAEKITKQITFSYEH